MGAPSSSSSIFCQARLVVDRHRGAVLDGPLDVVDVDVVAEDRARVAVGQLDGRAGEADEGGVGQRVAHVAGEAVDEVVLAAVGLVGDDHDVAPLAEQRCASPGSGQELLDGGEDDAARGDLRASRAGRRGSSACTGVWRSSSWQPQKVPKSWSSRSLRSVITTMVGLLSSGWAIDLAGIEGHRQALAAALRVPHHADRRSPARRRRAPSPRPPCSPPGTGGSRPSSWRWPPRRPRRRRSGGSGRGSGAGSSMPRTSVSSAGVVGGSTPSPSIVRQGMKRSQSPVSVPARVTRPSETTSTSLVVNRVGICCL